VPDGAAARRSITQDVPPRKPSKGPARKQAPLPLPLSLPWLLSSAGAARALGGGG